MSITDTDKQGSVPCATDAGAQEKMSSIPVISLWQPWASLIFARVKIHETRSKPAPAKYIGQRIGIHATAKFPPLAAISSDLHELCMDYFGCHYNYSLQQGAILGTVRLVMCLPTTDALPVNSDDLIAGDWRPGRYAWKLSDPVLFPLPILAKGKQGWWQHKLTASIEATTPNAQGTHAKQGAEVKPLTALNNERKG